MGAFVNVNNQMHEQDFDDSMSGTTAITAFFNNTEVFVANIGDSRAIIGEKKGKRVIAYSLSIDQTPYRQDERERVKQAGAVIMSCDQLEGIVEYQPLTQEEVNARIQCSSKPAIFPLGKTGYSLRYAYLSQRGYYPEDLYKNNQDSFKIVESFGGNPETIFLGVFDGHGSDGDSCSYFVRDHIEEHLKATMK